MNKKDERTRDERIGQLAARLFAATAPVDNRKESDLERDTLAFAKVLVLAVDKEVPR